jgi:hypothetical protein
MVFSEDLPVQLSVERGASQSRLTALFRPFLALPHLVWLALWWIGVLLAVSAAWAVAVVFGSVPETLQRFLRAYVRYAVHVFAYVFLVGRRFPGFTGRASSYDVDVEIGSTGQQSRPGVLCRPLLAVPALVLSCVLMGTLAVAAALSWPYTLVAGRAPGALRDIGSFCLRYFARATAYFLLCSDRYPRASTATGVTR